MPSNCPRCGAPRVSDARFCQICGGPLVDDGRPADPLLGETVLGRYRVVRVVGEGSMGRVYLGEQRVGEAIRHVAIKVLAAARGNDDYIIARFRREAATVASLEHPNIIKLYDYGEENGRFLSVMEYVPGGSLAGLIARGRIAPQRVESIAWQIAGALDEAHRRGVVHRDLKPENVLLATPQEGASGDVVKVVDFGIARRPSLGPGERPLTITGAMLGTPAFMAPEQFMGETADARADVYALAMVVYQMLAGVLPWAAVSVVEWGEAHTQAAPRPLRTQPGCATLPERYDAALAHALVKDPRRRTQSTLEFMRELTGAPSATRAAAGAAPQVVGAMPAAEGDLAAVVRPSGGALFVVVAALGVVLAGASVAAWLALRAVNAPAPAAAPPPAALVDAGARRADAAAAPVADPVAERSRQTLRDGVRLAQADNFAGALAALERVRHDGKLAASESEALRRMVERLGLAQVRRLLPSSSHAPSAQRCSDAHALIERLTAVNASGSTRPLYASRCPEH